MNAKSNVIDHPLVQHKLTLMRKKETSTNKFRSLMKEVSILLAYEVTRSMPLKQELIETPLGKMNAPVLEEEKIALISILRAGNGILDGFLNLLPTAHVGHVGLYREERAKSIVEYYFKVPSDISERVAIVLDPMLATGQTAIACISKLKLTKPKAIKFVSILSSPEGIEALHNQHPDVDIFTAGIDEGLDAKKYIIPGMGDAGDRLFGTL